VISIYYGMNTYIDNEVGRVLKRLSELGLEENTIVIYTTDHGDYMCEHGMIRKSKALYDCLIRIPLIVTWPDHIKGGQAFTDLVSMIDIMPTLMEILGLEIPPGVQGMSFLPLMNGGSYESREAIFVEHGLEGRFKKLEECTRFPKGPLTPDFSPGYKSGTGRIKGVRTGKWKLVYYPNGEGELYDMESDPWELTNLYGRPEYSGIVHELERRVLNWTIESEDRLPSLRGRQVD
jgi:arylsulfatase A-like enzyme